MAIMDFIRRKEDREEIDESFVPSKGSVRDKKENLDKEAKLGRRRKKELLPPWTKKERYLVLVVLLVTVFASGILGLSARSWKLPNFPKLGLPKFSFFDSEPIVIEKKKSSIDFDIYRESLSMNFNKITNSLSGVYGLYVIDLESKEVISVNEDEVYEAASLIKLPVIASMYSEAQKGNIDLDETYILKNSDKVSGSGSLSASPAGTKITYRELIKLMGQKSDNTAYRICLNAIGGDKVGKNLAIFGMNDTSIEENSTTLRDVADFFVNIWEKNILSESDSEEILDFLTDTIYENWIPQLLPENIRVAHKFGREVHVVNDAGIVYAQRPYVVVIMSKGIIESEADKAIPEISKLVYDTLTGFP